MRDGAAKAEARLFVAVEHAHAQSGGALDQRQERARVRRFSHGARRDGVDSFGAELPRERRHAVERLEARIESTLADSSPVEARPAASRGAAFISSTTWIAPSGETSATIWRIELEPMSIAATRRCPGEIVPARALVASDRKNGGHDVPSSESVQRRNATRSGTVSNIPRWLDECRLKLVRTGSENAG